MLCVGTVASLATTRKTVNRSGHRTKNGQERKARAKVRTKAMASRTAFRKGKKVRKVTNMPMDEPGMTSKLKNGGIQQEIRMDRVQYSGRMPMIRPLGNQKDQFVELR